MPRCCVVDSASLVLFAHGLTDGCLGYAGQPDKHIDECKHRFALQNADRVRDETGDEKAA